LDRSARTARPRPRKADTNARPTPTRPLPHPLQKTRALWRRMSHPAARTSSSSKWMRCYPVTLCLTIRRLRACLSRPSVPRRILTSQPTPAQDCVEGTELAGFLGEKGRFGGAPNRMSADCSHSTSIHCVTDERRRGSWPAIPLTRKQ
jgi:hypothetical protein